MLNTARPIFLYVGRVAIEKNVEAFLRLDLPCSKWVAGEGPAPVQGLGAPSAIADGLMECRRSTDGHWLFTLFAPKQALIGEDDFMKLMLALNAKK